MMMLSMQDFHMFDDDYSYPDYARFYNIYFLIFRESSYRIEKYLEAYSAPF